MTVLDLIQSYATEDGDCLIWQRSTSNGYPAMRFEGTTQLVRRIQWKLLNDTIPKGHIIRATCGNVLCVNPEHSKKMTYSALGKQLGPASMGGVIRGAKIARNKRALYGNHDVVAKIKASE